MRVARSHAVDSCERGYRGGLVLKSENKMHRNIPSNLQAKSGHRMRVRGITLIEITLFLGMFAFVMVGLSFIGNVIKEKGGRLQVEGNVVAVENASVLQTTTLAPTRTLHNGVSGFE